MYYALKESTRLRMEDPAPIMFSVKESETYFSLNPIYSFLMASCNGYKTEHDLRTIVKEGFGYEKEKTDKIFKGFLNLCKPFLDITPEPHDIKERYSPFDFLYELKGIPAVHRLRSPVQVNWLVTYRCPYDCVYCCIPITPANSPKDGEMTTDEGFAFLEDCVNTDVTDLTFHGGEPFLRPDLPDFIKYLVEHDIWVKTSTKLPLGNQLLKRLRDSGLQQLQISIDSPAAQIATDMVGGIPNYLKKAFRNIKRLQEYGIEPTGNAVVTSRNIKGIPKLVRMLADAGVRDISLSSLIRSYYKPVDHLFPSVEEIVQLHEDLKEMEPDLPEDMEIDLPDRMDPRDGALCDSVAATCAGGKLGIVIAPNGDASICDRLLTFRGAIVGNVNQSTIQEIWDGKALDRFVNPKIEDYQESTCGACSGFDGCSGRIRCHFRAMHIEGKLFTSDYLCKGTDAPAMKFF